MKIPASPFVSATTPDRLPLSVAIGGAPTTFRLLTSGDQAAILTFGRAQPVSDLIFMRRDITDPADVASWLAEIESGSTMTVVAVDAAGTIEGYASLARSTARWTRHLAEIHVFVDMGRRGEGLGRALLELAFELALESGVAKLVAQVPRTQPAARRLFESLGFEAEAVLLGHVIDAQGERHDLHLMSFDTERHPMPTCDGCRAFGVTRLPFAGRQLCWSCYEIEYGEIGAGE